MELSDEIMEVLEDDDWTLCRLAEYNGKVYADIQNYSPLGENIIETIVFDGTDKGFINSVKEYAASFDTDDHAETWIQNREINGGANSIRQLIDDAYAIQEMLNNLADELDELDI